MRTRIAESVIADAKRILRDHAAGIEVPPESLDWAVFIALANLGPFRPYDGNRKQFAHVRVSQEA